MNTQWQGFKTIVQKEFLRFIRIWVQTVLPPMITTLLYFVIFGQLIGSQVADIEGYSYMEYLVPGLILMSVLTNSYANVVSSFFSAKYFKHIEELLVSPVKPWVIVFGYMAGGVLRGLIVGVAVSLVALFFAPIKIISLPVVAFIALLTASMFALMGLINAIFAKSFDGISIIPTFVLTPLTYLGGVFYSITMLPEIWQKISLFNPILYMINGFRAGMLGVSDISLFTSFIILIGFNVGLFLLCVYLLQKGIRIKS